MATENMPTTRQRNAADEASDTSVNRAGLSVRLLGPLEACLGGRALDVRPAMTRNLLALLALDPGRTVPRDELIGALWDGDPPATVVNLLQVYASRLRAHLRGARRAAGDHRIVVPAGHGGYRLAVEPDAVDLTRFDQLVADARGAAAGGDTTAAIKAYESALRCWRGPILADLGPRLQQLPAAVAARQRRAGATIELARLYGDAGRHRAAVDVLERAASGAPLHEGLHARLMLALNGAGDRAAAFATHESIRRRLAEELGVDPCAELQAAYLELLRDGAPQRAVDRGRSARPPLPVRGGAGDERGVASIPVAAGSRAAQPQTVRGGPGPAGGDKPNPVRRDKAGPRPARAILIAFADDQLQIEPVRSGDSPRVQVSVPPSGLRVEVSADGVVTVACGAAEVFHSHPTWHRTGRQAPATSGTSTGRDEPGRVHPALVDGPAQRPVFPAATPARPEPPPPTPGLGDDGARRNGGPG